MQSISKLRNKNYSYTGSIQIRGQANFTERLVMTHLRLGIVSVCKFKSTKRRVNDVRRRS